MSMKFFKIIALFGFMTLTVSFDYPTDWEISGWRNKRYEIGIDKGMFVDGQSVMTIKSKSKKVLGYGLVSKSLKANIYLNKRIRLTGYLKTKDVIGWSGFLLQIDDEIKKERLVYDNMSERDIEGTNDWKKYEVVLDVPSNATVINYGTMLAGGGQIWSYGINIEIVDTTVAVTGIDNQKKN